MDIKIVKNNNKSAPCLFFVVGCLLLVVSQANAEENMLSYVRVVYRPDGGVSIIHVLAGACQNGELMAKCLDREYAKNESLKGLPYDDVPADQLPKDRGERDKWVGEKGKGISIDKTKVTKSEKIQEFQAKLDEEVEKSSPSAVKIAKFQHLIDKVKKINTPNNIRSVNQLSQLEDKKQTILATVLETVGSAFSSAFDGLLASIQNGFLAIKNLVVGTPEQPSGITIYDQTTKQPFCLVMKDGKMESIPGACPSISGTSDVLNIGGGNLGTSDVQNIGTLTIDTTSPVVTLNGPAVVEIIKGTAWTDPGATVIDPAVGSTPANTNLSIYYKLDGVETGNGGREPAQIDINTVGSHTIIYSATDSAGNTGTAARTVNVAAPAVPVVEPATTTPGI